MSSRVALQKSKQTPTELQLVQLSSLVALELEDGAPPKRFRVLKRGMCQTSKGVFHFSEKSAQAVLAAQAEYANDYVIDYGHGTVLPPSMMMDPASQGRAAGWCSFGVDKEGDLYAENVRWTPTAERMLRDREYRYFSPTFRYAENGEVMAMVSIALTNTPATYGMQPLMASQSSPTPPEPRMELKLLAQKLGLPETSTEAEVLAALDSKLAPAAQLSQLTGKEVQAEQLAVLQAWKASVEQVTALSTQVAERDAKLAEFEKAQKQAALSSAIEAGKREGRVTPAMEPLLKGMELAQAKAFIEALPKAVPTVPAKGVETLSQGNGPSPSLTADEQSLCNMLGIEPAKYAATRQKTAGSIPTVVTAPGGAAPDEN